MYDHTVEISRSLKCVRTVQRSVIFVYMLNLYFFNLRIPIPQICRGIRKMAWRSHGTDNADLIRQLKGEIIL